MRRLREVATSSQNWRKLFAGAVVSAAVVISGCSDEGDGAIVSDTVVVNLTSPGPSGSMPASSPPGGGSAGGTVSSILSQPPAEPSPLEAFRLSDEEKALVYDTWQLGMQVCMSELGFEYDPVSLDDLPPEATMPVDAEGVARYGYDFPPGADEMFVMTNDDQIAANPAYRAALLGPNDSTGCKGNAQSRAYGDDSGFSEVDSIVGAAVGNSNGQAATSQQFADLSAAWSSCMGDRGYDFDSVDSAVTTFTGGTASELEVKTRVADLGCQAGVEYELRFSQIVNEHAREWMDNNPGALQEWTAAKETYMADLTAYRAELTG